MNLFYIFDCMRSIRNYSACFLIVLFFSIYIFGHIAGLLVIMFGIIDLVYSLFMDRFF